MTLDSNTRPLAHAPAPSPRRWVVRRLAFLMWPLLLMVPVTLGLAWGSMQILSASRAYIAAEGRWSKAQKDAVFDLLRYVQTRNPEDYAAFQRSLAVPLGDRRARLELLSTRPDADVVREGFLAGENHPDDLGRMVWLFRHFGEMSFMQRAIEAWTAADAEIANLEAAGARAQALIVTQALGSEQLRAEIEEIRAINDRLRPLQDAFSETLGNAYRSVQTVLFSAIAATTLALLLAAWLATRRMVARTLEVEGELAVSVQEALAQRERAAVTLRSIGDAVVTVGPNGAIDYLNPVAELLTGWTDAEARGLPFGEVVRIVYEHKRVAVPDPVSAVLAEGRPLRLRHPAILVRRDGGEIPISESSAPIVTAPDVTTGAVIVFRDVSRERRVAAKLSHQASHDALTGLLNRREFERVLGRAVAGAVEKGAQHCLLYIDLDQFKVVNDTAGHAAGDELLRKVAGLLGSGLREGDKLGRLGGDEFGVLLENSSLAGAVRVAEAMRRRVEEMRFPCDGRSYSIGASIGVVPLSATLASVEEAIAAADRACYTAKGGGRNKVVVHYADDEGAGEGGESATRRTATS